MMQRYHGKHAQYIVLTLFCLIVSSGVSCTSTADKSDAKAVAKAFLSAVADGNAEEASQYVAEEEREDFLHAMTRGMPEIPAGYDLIVRINGERADANIDGQGSFGFDMIRRDGKWAVTK